MAEEFKQTRQQFSTLHSVYNCTMYIILLNILHFSYVCDKIANRKRSTLYREKIAYHKSNDPTCMIKSICSITHMQSYMTTHNTDTNIMCHPHVLNCLIFHGWNQNVYK